MSLRSIFPALVALLLSGCASSQSWNSEYSPPSALRELADATRTRIIEVPITPNTQHWISAPSEEFLFAQAKTSELEPEEMKEWFEQFRPYVDFTAYSQDGELVRATAWADSDDPKSVDALLHWAARQFDSAATLSWMRKALEGEGIGVTEGPRGRIAVKRSTDPNFYFVEIHPKEPIPLVQVDPSPPTEAEIDALRETLGFESFERSETVRAEGVHSRWTIRNGQESAEVHLLDGNVAMVMVNLVERDADQLGRVSTTFAKWCAPNETAKAEGWIRGSLSARGMKHGRAFDHGVISVGAFSRELESPPSIFRFDAMFPTTPRTVDDLWEDNIVIDEDDD
ncbi:MAG: hypothetical protein AAF488_17040 [Planctomycetota bacterium]